MIHKDLIAGGRKLHGAVLVLFTLGSRVFERVSDFLTFENLVPFTVMRGDIFSSPPAKSIYILCLSKKYEKEPTSSRL